MSKGYSGLFQAAKVERREPDFYTGNNGKTMLAVHKRWIGVNRRERLLAKAKHPKLKDAINQLYRPGSFIGDGGTASVLKFEKATGLGLGKNGKPHTQKAKDYAVHLSLLIKSATLSKGDRKLALSLYKKLIKALKGE
jgi:hypothetical protein